MECKYPEFGEYLRGLRARTGKSQRALAKTSPVSPGRIGQLEQGAGLPRPQHVRGLARAYEAEEREMMQRLWDATLSAAEDDSASPGYLRRLSLSVFPSARSVAPRLATA